MAARSVAVFSLPAGREAQEPPEARGLRRDDVKMLVSHPEQDRVEHRRFRDLPGLLRRGDVLVVNTSATINAALVATSITCEQYELHLSTPDPATPDPYGRSVGMPAGEPERRRWVVELRRPGPLGSLPCHDARPGMALRLPDGGGLVFEAPYGSPVRRTGTLDPRKGAWPGGSRLWLATADLPEPWTAYLERHGEPIRYQYVPARWPSSMYQTVFATEPGSAEMPSAARPFTPELVTRLVAEGVLFAPIVLHTGVSSLEDHEPPYAEYFRVPPMSAAAVNAARQGGGRVIAVGTTAVRAIETATDADGCTSAAEGWTELVIGRDRPPRSIDGIITGLHEPRASHLQMLSALVCDPAHLDHAYAEALDHEYLWHEFGDAHLLLGRRI